MAQQHQTHDSAHDHAHGSLSTYLAVFGGLIVLTALSFWIGNSTIKVEMPVAAWAGMMAVSAGKALLVILFFMHLKWEANWKYVLTIPAMMMSVFLLCMLVPDIGLRRSRYSEERLARAAELDETPIDQSDSLPHGAEETHGQEMIPGASIPNDH